MATLGERIQQRMRELKIDSLAQLARDAKSITRSRLSQIVNGKPGAEMTYKNTVDVARALGVNPDWLALGLGAKIASKANDAQWTAQWTEAQKTLLQDVRATALFLTDEQCRSFSQLIRSTAQGKEQVEA